ncbi:metal-dependent hydrolase family protein [Verminephrobacter eiseniae]|uniref:metal-dependent hydrolase family protein n=1 Tax=Verminephrobacter eiseniae TaxID=364317 RepID=UPI002237C004|nr:amidohydrolase family protein [Verminephrobacter eiseniae]MCW5235165.1 amidohydrolase family protein [Verminephrobacter eiseniae]
MSNITIIKNAHILNPPYQDVHGPCDIVIEGEYIKEIAERPVAMDGARLIDVQGRTVMPGLIDLHVHTNAVEVNLGKQSSMPNALVTLRSAGLMTAMLRRGFTTVRDAGGAGHPMKQAVQMGLIQGPRLFVSGRALSQTGGHGDMRGRSDFLAASECACCVRAGALGRVADGVDAVRRAVREEFQMGADQIKIMASGGVASPTDPIGAIGYSEEEIRAIVDEAQRQGSYVLAHAYTAQAITRAVNFGVRTIEHGNLVDGAAAAAMAKQGAYAVPTLVTYDALATEGEQYGLGPESLEKLLRVRDAGLGSLEIFKAAGVKMGFGSDLLGPSQRLQSEEFRLRRQVQSAAEVLTSATSIGAEVLDMRDRLGRLAANAWADLLVVDGNPLRDIGCLLGQGEKIPLVMKAGVVEFNTLGGGKGKAGG